MVGRKCREARVPSCEARCHFHWWAAPVAQGRPMNAGLDPFAQGPHGACDRGSRGATAVRILCRSLCCRTGGFQSWHKLAQVSFICHLTLPWTASIHQNTSAIQIGVAMPLRLALLDKGVFPSPN